jgi:phosphatidate cytidylyltransferase
MDRLVHAPSPIILYLTGPALLLLLPGTLVALFHPKLRGPERRKTRAAMLIWWPITLYWTIPCALGPGVALLSTALVSAVALREFIAMLPQSDRHPVLDALAFAAVPLHYAAAALGDTRLFLCGILAWGAFVLPLARMRLVGPKDFLAASSRMLFGLVTCVLALSHIYLVFRLPGGTLPVGVEGLAAYLILCVLLNDGLQWITGKLFGKHKIAPIISPNKTWEGFLGGMLATTALSIPISQQVLPVSPLWGALGAVGICTFGYLGDIYVSAIKRDLGVKDAGDAIPGQGGVLDRHDSFMINAPLFAWLWIALLGA